MRVILAAALMCVFGGAASAQVSDATRASNAAFSQTLPWGDREDEDFATRGFVSAYDQPQIRTADGSRVTGRM